MEFTIRITKRDVRINGNPAIPARFDVEVAHPDGSIAEANDVPQKALPATVARMAQAAAEDALPE